MSNSVRLSFTVRQYGKRLDGKYGLTGSVSNLDSANVRSQWQNAVKRRETISVHLSEDMREIPLWHFLPTYHVSTIGVTYIEGKVIYTFHHRNEANCKQLDDALASFGYSLESHELGKRVYRLSA